MCFVGVSLLSWYSIIQNAMVFMIFETERDSTKLWQVERNKEPVNDFYDHENSWRTFNKKLRRNYKTTKIKKKL